MAEKKIYIGSIGPLLFEDTDDLDDADGDFSGVKLAGIITSGIIKQEGAPVDPEDSVRLEDISVGTTLTSEDFRYAFMLGGG